METETPSTDLERYYRDRIAALEKEIATLRNALLTALKNALLPAAKHEEES
jgi:hypothetical protein